MCEKTTHMYNLRIHCEACNHESIVERRYRCNAIKSIYGSVRKVGCKICKSYSGLTNFYCKPGEVDDDWWYCQNLYLPSLFSN